MSSIKGRLVISVLIALVAILLTWLLQGQTSPFEEYFSAHVGLLNIWRALNALPFIAGAMISDSHGGSPPVLFTILQFLQWFIVAFVLLTLFSRVFGRTLR